MLGIPLVQHITTLYLNLPLGSKKQKQKKEQKLVTGGKLLREIYSSSRQTMLILSWIWAVSPNIGELVLILSVEWVVFLGVAIAHQ